jgi:hypothetical protein
LPVIVPENLLSPIDETTLHAYYLTPDGRWILGLGGIHQLRFGGGGYKEVHPVVVAHDWLTLMGDPLPDALEPYRESATTGFDDWLRSRHRKASQSHLAARTSNPSGDPATPRPGTPQATREAKGTPGKTGRRRGRTRKPLTPLETEVWKLYERNKGDWSPYQDIADILKPDYPGLKGSHVGRIVRKIKARQDRDAKASPRSEERG